MSQAVGARTAVTADRASALPRALGEIWPVALFFVLSAIMTYPLILDLGGRVIHGFTADADVSRWDLWWVKTSLFERHDNPFYTDMLYYPYRQASSPLNLYYHTLQPFNALLALPLLLATGSTVGPTLGYNVLVLVHFVLTGCAMFWLVRHLTGSQFAGVVAGVLFNFSPVHQFHLQYGQLELIPFEWLPLFVLFVHKLLYPPTERPRPWLNGGLALASLVAASFTSWYLTLYMLVMGGLLLVVRLWDLRGNLRAWRRPLIAFGGVLVVWLVIVGPFLYVTMRAAADPSFVLVSGLDYEARFSLNPLDIVGISKDTRLDPPVWNIGSLGYAAMILGAIGAWRVKRRGFYWYLLIVVGIVMALGPYLTLNDAIDVDHTTGIPLPYLLVRNLPFLSISRVPRRFIVLAQMGLDVLAGYGAIYLLARARQWAVRARAMSPGLAASAAMGLLVVVPMLELATIPQPAEKVLLSPFFSQIAARDPGPAIMEMPVTSHYLRDHARMFYQTAHGKKIIGGYTARRVVDYYLDPDSPFYVFIAMQTRPKPDVLPPLSPSAVLNFYDIPYLVFYKQDESYERPGDRGRVEGYVKSIMPSSAIVADDEQLTAYRVPPTGNEPLVWMGNGWYDPEYKGAETWRWSSGSSTLRINNKAPVKMPISFRSKTLGGDTNLTVSLDGNPVKTFKVNTVITRFDLGTLDLAPGEHSIRFSGDSPPATPASVGGAASDERLLAFVIQDLSLK